MLLDYLSEVAVPIVIAILGAGILGARRVSRRTETDAPPAPPPPPAPDPETATPDEIQRWLLAEVARLASAQEHLERVVEDLAPVVTWIDNGAHPPPPTVSAAVRRLLGLHPNPETR